MNRHFRIGKGFAGVAASLVLVVTAPQALANDVIAMKHALYGAGYNVGNVNGTMDEAARAALRQFQSDQGALAVSGELDEATKRALGLMVAPMAATEAETVAGGVSAEAGEAVEEKAETVADTGIAESEDGGWSLF